MTSSLIPPLRDISRIFCLEGKAIKEIVSNHPQRADFISTVYIKVQSRVILITVGVIVKGKWEINKSTRKI